ncbi:MAG: hypothetical protein KDI56_03670, partial [Xanthomonadales bacterium]|nr:hypothetical protein [Xanthomonadales bacterium]
MSEQTVFLVKTGLAGLEEIEVDGHLALDDYETFSSTIRRQLGADTASLFAEPIVTRSRDRESGSVAWYTSRRGQPRRLVECDSQERAAAEALLRTRLDDVAGLLDDPGIGPRLGAWLHFPSLEDVWVVGGQPVLTNWGMLPVGVARDGDQRAEHYASTM